MLKICFTMNNTNNNKNNAPGSNGQKLLVRVVIFILYVLFLFYLFHIFTNLGIEGFLSFLILLFFLLLMIGPVFFGFKSPFYARIFQKKTSIWTEKTKKDNKNSQSNKPRPFSTEINFRKPLIRTCPYCGMIVANFVKKCPQCSTSIID